MFSFGVRSTVSLFNDGDAKSFGTGSGGQFRIQLSDHVNTEWFYDYIAGNVGDFAHRTDQHIGWSVVLYLLNQPKSWQPYFLVGHCFDYSLFIDNHHDNNSAERWSSAVQAGFGTHINLTNRFNFTTTLQYMIHLANDISTTNDNGNVTFQKQNGVDLIGHLLVNFSVNYKLSNLW